MAEIQRKKRLRACHRSSTTRIINLAYQTLADDEGSLPKLKQQWTSLQEKLETLKKLDMEILDLIDEEELDNEIEQADSCREQAQLALYDIQAVIKRSSKTTSLEEHAGILTSFPPLIATSPPRSPPPSPVITSPPRSSPSVITSSPPTAGIRGARVKLPKISLRKFDGDPLQWSTFWDLFQSTVHDNPDMSEIDKFNYLNLMLERTAADAVSGLALTSANYEEAVAVLKKRFGDRHQIIAKHMETLLSLQPVLSSYDVKLIRQLHDKVESHIRSLKALGIPTTSYGSLLTSALPGKLPANIRLIVSRSIQDEDWNLDALMTALSEEIEAHEHATTAQVHATPSKPFIEHKRPKELPTARTMFSSSACVYCDQMHSSNSCTSTIDVGARKQILKRTGRCFNCLRKNHLSKECCSTTRCHQCKGKHHTSICDRSIGTESQVATKPLAAAQTASTSMYADVRTPVLLQTARAIVSNPYEPDCRTEVQLIFDGGSQRSYITDRLSQELHLYTESIETVLIKTFGCSVDQTQICNVVNVDLEVSDGSTLRLCLLSVPFICDPLAGQTLTCAIGNHPHLTQLDLADVPKSEESRQLTIDILIGADMYWDLVTGEVVRHENCPTAISTSLGWVLSGPLETQMTDTGNTHVLYVSTQTEFDTTLNRFSELESLGIVNEEDTLYNQLKNTIKFKENRYEVALPWKEHHPPLPSNYELSVRRLTGLLRRLRKDPQLLQEYDAVIRDQIDKGIIEIVAESNSGDLVNTHYIPHHAIVRRDKETTGI
jgi:hypothetical protein